LGEVDVCAVAIFIWELGGESESRLQESLELIHSVTQCVQEGQIQTQPIHAAYTDGERDYFSLAFRVRWVGSCVGRLAPAPSDPPAGRSTGDMLLPPSCARSQILSIINAGPWEPCEGGLSGACRVETQQQSLSRPSAPHASASCRLSRGSGLNGGVDGLWSASGRYGVIRGR
jgi:hypothetical protein